MTKIRTTLKHRAGRVVTFGDSGKIKFDENCESNVDEKLVEKLQELDSSIELASGKVKEDKSKEETVKHTVTKEDLENNEELKDAGIQEGEEIEFEDELDLSSMTLAQLQDAAKEANFPEDEWKKLKKADMVNYMTEKLQVE